MSPTAPPARFRTVLLWALAGLLMAATVIYQRRTGPTHPLRGSVTVAGQTLGYRFLRSEETLREARVALPDSGLPATLVWRRFPLQEAWNRQPMVREQQAGGAELAGYLPKQPPAGKLEYFVEVGEGSGVQRLPEGGPLLLRYKGPVALAVLLPHVALMFIAVLLGLRTGLGALFSPTAPRRLLWSTLACMTLGGLVLGPFVQKAAFGHYWTGFPWGTDLTDNKTLLMWGAWALAALVAGLRPRANEAWSRAAVLAATVVMAGVYLIPHSLRGSQLDYGKVQKGATARDAVITGR